jgi:hypothetical protein
MLGDQSTVLLVPQNEVVKVIKHAFLMLLILCNMTAARAMTLEGQVEHIEEAPAVIEHAVVVERGHKYKADGHIGVRISCWGYVDYVHPGSPAETMGLVKGDRVTRVDGHKHNVNHISGDPGTTVELEVKRHRDVFTVNVERINASMIMP